jgi:predicted alpha/beta-hydrolase family hydrolase
MVRRDRLSVRAYGAVVHYPRLVKSEAPRAIKVEWAPGASVTALAYAAARPFAQLVLGHGAGADQRHPFMVGMAARFAARGVDTVTFNFGYTEAKRRAPDPNAKLEACVRAVIAKVRGARPLFLGGKSMGGRIASQVAAADDGIAIAGLVFLGYPLHPPGKPEQLRSAHLPKVPAPMLFVQGERDAFGTTDEIGPLVVALNKGKRTKRTRLLAIEGGDHSLTVPKRLGVSQETVLDDAADTAVAWMREVLA